MHYGCGIQMAYTLEIMWSITIVLSVVTHWLYHSAQYVCGVSYNVKYMVQGELLLMKLLFESSNFDTNKLQHICTKLCKPMQLSCIYSSFDNL